MLDGVTGRVLELKHALVTLDCCDYQYFDAILSDLKLTPKVLGILASLCAGGSMLELRT